jgi:uncharacterized protein YciI
MHYIVIAHDDIDAGALERRLAAREAHLKLARENFDKGILLYAAGILDDEGVMIGSMLVCDFSSHEELDQWLKIEPYVTGDVWKKIEVNHAIIPPFLMNG